jgi:2-succinyl-6-hydroxy-2,4-cyclohexadiene-1-carboxylate synthase
VALLGARTILCPAILGHGAHSRAATFEQEVDRVAAAVTEAGLGGATVCGYSMGGRLAVGLLARHPGLFGRAVVVGAHPGLVDDTLRRARRRTDDEWAALIERGIGPFVDAWERHPVLRAGPALNSSEAAAQRAIRLAHDPDGLRSALDTLGLGAMPSYREDLPTIATPTLWMAGELDPKFSGIAREAARAMPAGAVAIVHGAGHNVLLTHPETVARAITEPWAMEHGGASADGAKLDTGPVGDDRSPAEQTPCR